MSTEIQRKLTIELIEKMKDANLLDLIYKLAVRYEGGE